MSHPAQMVVTNPEPVQSVSVPPRLTPEQRRLDVQQRRRLLATAYGAAVGGFPRAANEAVYALPARFSTSTARVDDPVLRKTYAAVAELHTKLSTSDPVQRDEAVCDMAVLVSRLRPGQRRYLAQQMVGRGVPPSGTVCGVCWDTLTGEASVLPCGDHFHGDCVQTTLDNSNECRCPICHRDLALAALLHDAMAQCKANGATGDPDALWKTVRVPRDLHGGERRPLTPPLDGAAPPLASVKESWRTMINAAYDANEEMVKDREWQLEADLRRLAGSTTHHTLRDQICLVHDIARILQTAGWNERKKRALSYLQQQVVRAAHHHGPMDLTHVCAVCRTPIASSETSSPPCKHVVHAECWPSWFETRSATQCPVCYRDVAVYACMASIAAPDGPQGETAMKGLWLTVEELYF